MRTLRDRVSVERALVAAAALLVLAVHDVGYMLDHPYWTDESWVAMSFKFPLSDLTATTGSTPIGWSFLGRLFGGAQNARLLPLLFAAGCIPVAYWSGRRLAWSRREYSIASAVLCAFAALLAPAMLIRNDLKQYTADVFMTLVCLTLLARAERTWSRRTLAALAVAVPVGMLVSHISLVVGAACFCGILTTQAWRREWPRVRDTAIAGAGTTVLSFAIYVAFDARGHNSRLDVFWRKYFAPGDHGSGIGGVARFIGARVDTSMVRAGLGPWWLAIPLIVAGIVTVWRLGHRAVAVALIVIWPEMITLSGARSYPFLDSRTSTFLFVLSPMVAAIGIVGLCAALRAVWRGAVSGVLVAAAVVLFLVGGAGDIRRHTIPTEDVRAQARYVAAHIAPGDVVVVNMVSNWMFGYYWPGGDPARQPNTTLAQDYITYFPDDPRIIVATTRGVAGVQHAVDQALALARASTPHGRIWLVLAHVNLPEKAVWAKVLTRTNLYPIRVGVGLLSYARPRV